VVLVLPDISVLMDLERGGLLELSFCCNLPLVVPDLLYDRELERENGPYLRSLGLGIVTLASKEMSIAQQVYREAQALTLPACFAISYAGRPGHALLCGEQVAKNEAASRDCQVFGLLWLLDQMAVSKSVPKTSLSEGLNRISSKSRTLLARDEVALRLKAWRE
jgi:hypothetical protein